MPRSSFGGSEKKLREALRETLGGFEAAQSQFRRVIKRQCGQSTRCLRRDRAEAISEAFLRLWGGAGGAATPKEGFKVSGCQKSVSEDHKNGVWPRHTVPPEGPR